ncbi:MAG: pyruvate formate lyase family protein [Desulfobacterales bacterium]|nr:pyruvate formate lyase family protein [Desulfobacterales bacterium]
METFSVATEKTKIDTKLDKFEDNATSNLTQPTERVLKVRQNLLNHAKPYYFCSERARLITQSYQETEGKPILERRAMAMQALLKKMSVYIMDNELIVGQNTKAYVGAPIFPEVDTAWLEEELKIQDQKNIGVEIPLMTEDVKKDLKEVVSYWKGKSLRHLTWERLPEQDKVLRDHLVYMESMDPAAVGRTMIDVKKVLASGFLGLKEEIEKNISQLPKQDPEYNSKVMFWRAAATICQAMADFGKRYADEAKRLANIENSPQRKKELLKIADICSQVPARPARSFHEALQSCWFTQLIALSEHGGEGPAPGRIDQYLYPYYKKDLQKNFISKEEAQELLDLYFIKGSETPKPRPSYSLIKFGRSGNINVNNHITIGGVDKHGNDATNELSYMLLEAQAHVQLPRPQTSLRIHKHSPKPLIDKAVIVNKQGGGLPQLIGDEAVIKGLVERGLSLDDARDYTMLGCSTVCAHGLYGKLHMGWYNIPKVLELTLNDGMDMLTRKKISISTGDVKTFKTFDEVMEAFKHQLDYTLKVEESGIIAETDILKEELPLVYTSILLNDCIEKGKDLTNGGARYNWGGTITGVGIVTAGESLYAIKKMVFEDRKIDLQDLIHALERNFEGMEELRQTLLNKIKKYGNDENEVDDIVKQAAHLYYDSVQNCYNPNGGKMWPEFHSVTFHVPLGMATGATPNGRKAFAPHQTGITPTSGCDKNGPTAVCKSASKLDLSHTNAASLFISTTPTMVAEQDKVRRFADVLKTYMVDLKGLHVQTNVVSPELLREAQANPESYRNLVVRVAGYSAFFVELDKKLQDDIILRSIQNI